VRDRWHAVMLCCQWTLLINGFARRRYAKQVQAERLKDKAKAKKASQAALKSLTKQKRSRGHMLEDSEVDRIMMGGAGRGGAPDAKKSWRRKRKDSRYGSGGKKRGSKRNDKASTMQGYKDFNSRRNREGTGRAARGGVRNGVCYFQCCRARMTLSDRPPWCLCVCVHVRGSAFVGSET